MDFNSIEELYKRVQPALLAKVNELAYQNIDYIKEKDIWDYLSKNKWSKAKDLTLADIVNDILKFNKIDFEKELDRTI